MSELTKSLIAFQREMPSAHKDGKNPHFNSDYATLKSVIDVARLALDHGIGFTQPMGHDETGQWVGTQLLHESGEKSEISRLYLPEGNPQQLGSAITYFRRYTLLAALGIATDDDDDGNQASQPRPQKRSEAPRPNKTRDMVEHFQGSQEQSSRASSSPEELFDDLGESPHDPIEDDQYARPVQILTDVFDAAEREGVDTASMARLMTEFETRTGEVRFKDNFGDMLQVHFGNVQAGKKTPIWPWCYKATELWADQPWFPPQSICKSKARA
jgi:hypothetical protein